MSIFERIMIIYYGCFAVIFFLLSILVQLNIGMMTAAFLLMFFLLIIFVPLAIVLNVVYLFKFLNTKKTIALLMPFLYIILATFVAIKAGSPLGKWGKAMLWDKRLPVYEEVVEKVKAGDIQKPEVYLEMEKSGVKSDYYMIKLKQLPDVYKTDRLMANYLQIGEKDGVLNVLFVTDPGARRARGYIYTSDGKAPILWKYFHALRLNDHWFEGMD